MLYIEMTATAAKGQYRFMRRTPLPHPAIETEEMKTESNLSSMHAHRNRPESFEGACGARFGCTTPALVQKSAWKDALYQGSNSGSNIEAKQYQGSTTRYV
jgi:hypothetical protein